jgi:hypothetical protein
MERNIIAEILRVIFNTIAAVVEPEAVICQTDHGPAMIYDVALSFGRFQIKEPMGAVNVFYHT